MSFFRIHIFIILCDKLESIHKTFLSYTKIPWLSPGKSLMQLFELWAELAAFSQNTIFTWKWKWKLLVQSCLTLCNPMDYTVHGILQARILEWIAFPFSRGSSQPKDWTQVSCTAGRFFTSWTTREALFTWKNWQTVVIQICVFGRNFLKNEPSEPVTSREKTESICCQR